MPAGRKPMAVEKVVEKTEPPVMCDNHPTVEAVHTTGSELHQPLSFCDECLSQFEHMRQR